MVFFRDDIGTQSSNEGTHGSGQCRFDILAEWAVCDGAGFVVGVRSEEVEEL